MAKKLNNVYINHPDEADEPVLMEGTVEDKRPRGKKDRGLNPVWLIWRPVVIVAISIVLVMIGAMYVVNYVHKNYFTPLDPDSTEVVEVTIERSSTLTDIANTLYLNGIIRNQMVFKLYADFSDMSYRLKAGTYELSPSMTYDDILYALMKGEPESLETQVTFKEGLTVEDMAEVLCNAEQGGMLSSPNTFLEMCRTGTDFADYSFIQDVLDKGDSRDYVLEGYLFPDTYRYFTDASERDVIDKLLSQFGTVFNDVYLMRAEELEMSIDEVIILASMIEKEAKEADFAKVSAVFHNRLEADMVLQSCATMQRVTGEAKYTFNDEELAIDSPYNTYMYEGLPVGPICNPGKAAIEAALYPDEEFLEEGYLYFCLTTPETGEQVFARTYDEHQANVAEWEEYWDD